jgi:hypothetical protein
MECRFGEARMSGRKLDVEGWSELGWNWVNRSGEESNGVVVW